MQDFLNPGLTGTPTAKATLSKDEYNYKIVYSKEEIRDFPGGPAAKTPHSQSGGPRSDGWTGNWTPHATAESSHDATKKKYPVYHG